MSTLVSSPILRYDRYSPQCVQPPVPPQGVDDLLGGGGDEDEDEDDGSVAPSIRSPSPAAFKPSSSIRELMNGDGSLMLFAGNSCSRMYVPLCLGFDLAKRRGFIERDSTRLEDESQKFAKS